jgi:hypothetical protein
MIKNNDHCPVCKEKNRLISDGGIASKSKYTGWGYLKHIAKKIGIKTEILIDDIKVYECLNCRNYYCDPWLSEKAEIFLFEEASPDHIAGWSNFENWLNNSFAGGDKDYLICQSLKKYIGNFNKYGEFVCPFQGLFFRFAKTELLQKNKRKIFYSSLIKHNDIRWTTIFKIYNLLHYFTLLVICFLFEIKFLISRILKKSTSTNEVEEFVPKEMYLIKDDSLAHWGDGCIRYGKNCSYFSNKVLNVTPMSYGDQIIESKDKKFVKFDLISIFNILDHTREPKATLTNLLQMSKNLLIVTHAASLAGKQHKFAFGDSFSTWLALQFKSYRVIDITREIYGNNFAKDNYILISTL